MRNTSGLIPNYSPDTPQETVVITARIKPEQMSQVKALSGSLSYHVRMAIAQYLKNLQTQIKQ